MLTKCKKFAKDFFIIVTGMLAIIQIYDWIMAPSSELQADASYGPLYYPPGLENEFEQIRNSLKTESLHAIVGENIIFDEPNVRKKRVLGALLPELSYGLQSELPTVFPDEYSRLSGFWSFEIRNGGDKKVQSVRLTVPYSTIALVTREGRPPIREDVNGVVALASVHPGESIIVKVWTSIVPNLFQEDDVMLSHSSGFGEITMYSQTGPIGRFVDSYWVVLLFTMPIFFVYGVLIFSRFFVCHRRVSTD